MSGLKQFDADAKPVQSRWQLPQNPQTAGQSGAADH